MENSVASRLQALLKTHGIDELELAKRIDKHPSTVYRILKKENEPSKTTVKLIAEALNVSPEWLMTGDSAKEIKINSESPWKDEAYMAVTGERDRLIEDIKFYKAIIQTKFGLNFKSALNHTGLTKERRLRVRAA